ncbi:beta-glucosidase family protein [Jidongwangia harbinensis]|uniref:beta-glucosidase family protein n=1 Tax=Jidongwangia harbinensis TaxID=2878561 RepID=UPI001CD9E050|nr:glycoside hydrolase family 3 C-terminal domain-containing protein [Jidongwangia harbinensis]MCA2217851.1 glycoside hydrolase family 3 C-terminal domain-containing protein [Jidongwangia harbinensis]
MTEYHDVIDDLLAELDLTEKVSLLAGQDFWSLPAIPRIGLRSLIMSDGPIGVRGTGWAPEDPSIALPSPTALAAAWDPALAERAGLLLGQESRRKGVHLLLGPTVNLHRTPLGGRHFECYSEDPLLSGEIGLGWVTGVQAHGVGTTVKHLVGNDFETDRMTVDVRIGDRALRELYLAPFERIVTAGAWGVMSAYNAVNGLPMASHGPLQTGVLKDEWGFDGFVVSDWRAARETVGSALGGLDIAMPAMENPWGDALVAAVRSGEVPEEIIDDKVRRVLRLAARVGVLDGVPPAVTTFPAPVVGDTVAYEVAVRSFVLATNTGSALPLDPSGLNRVAVIGALATDARVLGGGSAQVTPPHVVSPLDGLRRALPGADVAYAIGADPRPFLPPARGPEWSGLTVSLDGETDYGFGVDAATLRWIGDLPGGVAKESVTGLRMHGTFTPATAGEHTFAVSGFGTFSLTVGGTELYAGSLHPADTGRAELLLSPREHRVTATLPAGLPVEVVLTQTIVRGMAHTVSATLGHRAPGPDADGLIAEAVALAAASDVAVVVVGTTEQVESEGFDRTSLALPGRQDELVARVAAANPRTVVVVNAGSPVLLPWADDVAAVLLTWFPGQEAGAALADVLLGTAEPGGRLPTTWPRREEDCPVLAIDVRDDALEYAEGIFIGYRGWLRSGATPLFAFGHGLGYTSWSYDSLQVADGYAEVTVTNTGARTGREVVQVYLSAPDDTADRPVRWLAGFANVEAHPGESVTVQVPLQQRAFQVWDGGWRTVPGRYQVAAAHAVDDLRLTTDLTM